MKLETVFYIAIIVILIIILILQFLELPKSGQSEGYAPGLRRAFQRHNLNYDNPILTTEQNSRYRKEMKINTRVQTREMNYQVLYTRLMKYTTHTQVMQKE